MRISDSLCYIEMGDIDLSDERFCHFKPFADTRILAKSIQQAGLINPVLLRPAANRYIVVSGFNRVRAFLHNKDKTIPAFVLSGDMDDCACLCKAISAVTLSREISRAEMIRCIVHLSRFLSMEQISDRAQELFNTTLNTRFIKELAGIGKMQPSCLDLIESGRLSIKTAKQMIRFQPDQKTVILDLFSRIKASASIQSEIVQHVYEISKRDRIGMEALLADAGVTDVVNDPHCEPVTKTRIVRNILYENRFPALSKMKTDTREKISALKPGTDLRIEPSENFEAQHIRFSFKISTYPQFKKQVEILNRMIYQAELKDLLT